MPSPFPGMDPFLEHPEIFPDLHDGFIIYLRETLQAQLPEPYYAVLGRRLWVEVSRRPIGPDVNVVRGASSERREPANPGGVAVVSQAVSTPLVIHVPHDERRETYIDIYLGRGAEKTLVTTIEVLSPTNKTPGEHGRELYVQKQKEVLAGRVNLVEIDLLRGGQHATAVPEDFLRDEQVAFDYHICVNQAERWEEFHVYPVRLEDRLPTVSIPLLSGENAIPIDLQAVFNRCYDAGPYFREVRYQHDEPVPPLAPERREWLRGILHAAGVM